MDLGVGTLLSGASSAAGGILGSILNYKAQEEANETNLQIASDNRDFYYQQWLRENAYNDPSSVMQRLSKAGLNPNLMYGEGAGGLPASASMPAVDPGRVVAPRVDPLLMAQIGNIMADTALKKSQAGNQDAQADLAKNQIKVGDSVVLRNSKLNEMSDVEIKKLTQETDYLASLTDKANSDIMVNYAQVQNMTVQQQQRWMELALKDKEVDALCSKYASETAFTNEQVKYVGLLAMAKVYNLRADSALKEAQKGLTNAQIKECDQALENMKVQNAQMSWDLKMDQKFTESERSIKIRQAAADVVAKVADASKISLAFGLISGNYSDDRFNANMGDVNHLSR